MSDARLRLLERRWQQTGALEDEVAWLRARLRAGDLTVERLRLAAGLGHAASTRTLGDAAPAPLPGPETWTEVMAPGLVAFCGWLAAQGREPALRAVIAACRLVEPAWRASHPRDRALTAAVDQLERHLRRGDPVENEVLAAVGEAMFPIEEGAYAAAMTVLTGAGCADPDGPDLPGTLQSTLAYAADAARGPRMVHAALVAALVPWALAGEESTLGSDAGPPQPPSTRARRPARDA